MRRTIVALILITIGCGICCYSQGRIIRPQNPKNISDPDGYINGHGYVDLGLPSGTKWATCNVGASSSEEYGDYFAWGETNTKSEYSKENCLSFEKNIDNISRDIKHDASTYMMGNQWAIPSKKNWIELLSHCKFIWMQTGYKVIGKNGHSIFLPLSGRKVGSVEYGVTLEGYYWCSTPYSGPSIDPYKDSAYAYNLLLFEDFYEIRENTRFCGFTIRPISK